MAPCRRVYDAFMLHSEQHAQVFVGVAHRAAAVDEEWAGSAALWLLVKWLVIDVNPINVNHIKSRQTASLVFQRIGIRILSCRLREGLPALRPGQPWFSRAARRRTCLPHTCARRSRSCTKGIAGIASCS